MSDLQQTQAGSSNSPHFHPCCHPPHRLRELICNGSQVTDLSPLGACQALERLYCSGTAVGSLAALSSCARLSDLIIDRTNAADLSPLSRCRE